MSFRCRIRGNQIQDRPCLVDQHRVGEAELTDAGGDLPDLLLRMGAGIAGPRGECRNGAGPDLGVRNLVVSLVPRGAT